MLLLFILLLPLVSSSSSYVLKQDFSGNTFADNFEFFHGADPSGGFAVYVDRRTAERTGLYRVEDGKVHMGVDAENRSTEKGRYSVRLESKMTFDQGLFILDLAHIPGSVCGVWPAYWMVGPNWPNDGEIDIIEGESTQKRNFVTLHTGYGCEIQKQGNFTGMPVTTNCYDQAPLQPPNKGCSIEADREDTYGDGFNRAGGGIYAMEWTDQAIKVWHFSRQQIPEDIKSGQLNPSNWPPPLALFSDPCKISQHVKSQRLILNTDFCGGWVNSLWAFQCLNKGFSCKKWVRENPEAFKDAYWLINWLRVYEKSNSTKRKY